MKRTILWVLLAGFGINSYATDARVIAMGRHDNFFMDEVSIFKNPANINIYPNMVYGSYGVYRQTEHDTVGYQALQRNNRDPVDPFFGAIVSYALNQSAENRNQYPMFSIGAMFNRHDEMLDYITKGTDKFIGSPHDSILPPTGKIDLLLGYVLQNGGMIGLGSYLAFQSVTKGDSVMYETSLYKGTTGINLPVAKSTNLEISVGGGILRSKESKNNTVVGKVLANNDWFLRGDVRLFSALSMINGDFVPRLGVQRVNLCGKKITLDDLSAGLGININIDKGFFWTGIEGLYKKHRYGNTSASENITTDSLKTGIGGKVSLGIERSIWWDWFVIRVGGQKVLLYTVKDDPNGETWGRWEENNPSDGSDNDLVALGFGVNVENRLRVDFVAAEDLPYTFTNLISGPQHHIFTRVSATYSF